MNNFRSSLVGTAILFFLMTSPAGAENAADKLKQALDKFKQLQGQQQPNQSSTAGGQTAAPSQNNNPKAGSTTGSMAKDDGKITSSDSSGGSKAKGSGGVGPDVIGLRLRMTPSEAATAIKARPNLKDFREYHSVLQYQTPNGTFADLPNGEFRKYSHAYEPGDRVRGNDEEIFVFYAPVPGKDLVVGISRYQQFPDGKEPEYDNVIKALVDKYGKPSGRSGTSVEKLVWLYDANLKPRSKPVDLSRAACEGVPAASKNAPGANLNIIPGWALDPYNKKENIDRCGGETILGVTIIRRLVSPHEASPLVIGIDTRLSGLGDVLTAQQEANRTVAMHQKNTLGKEAAKAKQRKLDL